MKKLFSAYLLFSAIMLSAQFEQSNLYAANSLTSNLSIDDDSQPDSYASIFKPVEETFEEAAAKNNVTYRTFIDLPSTPNGYYVISGTYSKDSKRDQALKKLKKKGFAPGSVKNLSNNLNYVYLEYYVDWKKAIEVCTNKFDGRYKNDVWVMQVKNSDQPINLPQASKPNASEIYQLSNPISDLDLDYDEPTPTNTLKETVNKSKLIQKADLYFDKMWYAEAANLYEEALLKGEKYYTSDIIQKAADSYYYNTNMEKAYEWYNILYENYGKELSADNMFKYAHTLKGTGKYGRSKRLMKLYNKKIANNATISNASNIAIPNEVVLDNILAATNDKIEVKNLDINSEYSDFSPMFLDSSQVVFASAQDSSFLHTRKYKWNDQPYLDLYVAKLNEESHDLKDAMKFSKKINTKYHEASVAFSPDNSTMYFTRNNYGKKLKRDKNGVNNLKIYKSHKIEDEWSEAVELPFASDDYSIGHPALSPDGKQLYFISDMPGTMGATDLFVVDVLENNSFSEPRNLGPEINTDKREMFPYFNGEKLYFSSDGHTGLGGLDIFEASYSEDEGFGTPTNIGQPINSNKDDFSYIVDEESQKGFFASNREGGKGDDDIYSFENLLLEEVPANINAIAGVVTELVTGDLMPKALIELLDENNVKLKEIETTDDGSFIFEDLDSNTKYSIRANKNQYFENIITANTRENDTINSDISLKRLEELIAVVDGVKKLKTEMIHFDFDKSYIRTDAAIELDKMVAVMNEYPNMVIKIESHTDSRGSRVYNEYLSDKRAKSSRDYLIKQGIAPERIESAIGYGEARLINECNGTVKCTEQAHYLNRRSEFIITKM
ncbi:OmpA family protein [Aurantibacter sp.]|uniref:OmpA family protein n=1 Tax=Aurantibacter sp. TaxID=2807103 RepID=UPI003267DA00